MSGLGVKEDIKKERKSRSPSRKRNSIFGAFSKFPKSKSEIAEVKAQRRKSFQPTATLSPQKTGQTPNSILNYITGAEQIYETVLFSSQSRLTFKRNNLEWESKLADSLLRTGTGFGSPDETISVSIPEFLAEWEHSLEEGRFVKQYVA